MLLGYTVEWYNSSKVERVSATFWDRPQDGGTWPEDKKLPRRERKTPRRNRATKSKTRRPKNVLNRHYVENYAEDVNVPLVGDFLKFQQSEAYVRLRIQQMTPAAVAGGPNEVHIETWVDEHENHYPVPNDGTVSPFRRGEDCRSTSPLNPLYLGMGTWRHTAPRTPCTDLDEFTYAGQGTLLAQASGKGHNDWQYFAVVQFLKLALTLDGAQERCAAAALAEGDKCVGFHVNPNPEDEQYLQGALLYDWGKSLDMEWPPTHLEARMGTVCWVARDPSSEVPLL